MIIGILSDTHDIDDNTIKHIVREFSQRDVETIFHCGDIESQHLNPELFGNLPVVCALNKEQLQKEPFKNPPQRWEFTIPGERVLDVEHTRCYVGHKFSFDLAFNPEASFKAKLNALRREYDGLRYACAGHMHHQALAQTQLVTFINPGAVQYSPDGYEFAVIDTKRNQVVFSRIPRTKYLESPFTVGIISDSLNVSKLDADFWKKLAKEFKARDVSEIIHCGNLAISDIGREELASFQVHYRLRPEQGEPKDPDNWHLIPKDPPIVTINERQFYVHPLLARMVLEKSEAEMHKECLMVSETYPEISFILYGNTTDAYMSEEMDGRTRIMNPGNALGGKYATVCFPRLEITLAEVPFDPLPLI
jgi:predicted phosphodiesterase